MVMFLLRAFFWIGLFAMILTVDYSGPNATNTSSAPQLHEETSPDPFSFVFEFCTTNPDWCETIHKAGVKAYADIASLVNAVQDHFSNDLRTAAE